MHAEIIAIGSELTTGAKLDTNSQWLSEELAVIGIPVHFHTTVADDLDALVSVLKIASERSGVVLITGGLGPTLDDLTRQALAALTQTRLVLHEPSLETIQSMFARRNREMPQRNAIQAMFPEHSEPIPNLRGTAPGIWMEIARPGNSAPCQVAAMPGVPSEMKRMFFQQVLPRLPGTGNVIQRARVHCFGVGESQAEEMLGDLTARGRDPEVGITAHEATITLRITAQGRTAEECAEKIASAKAVVHERMGAYVFGEEEDELQQVVVRLLQQSGSTLATAEAGTGGLLAHRLTEVDDFQTVYLGGVVAPTETALRNLLNVDAHLLETAGPLSPETAGEMAIGCRQRFQTDFALSVATLPPFDCEDPNAESPRTYVALCGPNLLDVQEHTLVGDPAISKSRAAKTALNLLRLHLLQASPLPAPDDSK